MTDSDLTEAYAPDIASSTDDYATRFSGKIGAWFLEVQKRATLRFLKPYGVESRRIIDVGGGHGQNVAGILESGHQLVVTGSDATCAHRLERYLAEHKTLSFKICPLTQIPVPDREYDAVVSYRMLSHLDHWPEFVGELCRISKDRVIVDYPTYRSANLLNSLFFKMKKGVERNTRQFTIFNERDIIAVFEKHGFQLEGRVGQFVLPMAFHRMHKQVFLASFVEGICGVLGISWLFGSPVIASFRRKGIQ